MPKPVKVAQAFRDGMKRDFSRDQMPPNTLWNSVDFIPEILGAPIRKRGGYTYQGAATSAVTSTSDHIQAGLVAPFSLRSSPSNIAFDEDGHAFEITSSTANDIGLATPTVNPLFYSDKVIIPGSDGSTAPKMITSTSAAYSVTALTASAPAGKYAVLYKDVLWLAASSASSDRIYFSVAGNPQSWDTTNKWLDVSLPITGMAALANAVFVFMEGRTARIRGSIPPPDSDFIVDDPIFEVGCTDNRSISLYRDKVIWANASGLFISDGTAMDDLTAICGMKNWWLDIMAGREPVNGTTAVYDRTNGIISTGVYRDYLLYSVMSGTAFIDAGFIDLKRYVWGRFSNQKVDFYWKQEYPEELYAGSRVSSRIHKCSGLFAPTSATSADANGTVVTPYIETPYYMGEGPLQTFLFAFLEYDLRDPASADPILTLSYLTDPSLTSYTDLADTLPEQTAIARLHRRLGFTGRGIAFKIAQSNGSSDTRLYGVEVSANTQDSFK